MNKSNKSLSKKEVKLIINSKGGFVPMDMTQKNAFSKKAEEEVRRKYSKEVAEDILANAHYFEAVSSTGELNRNGYIIRAKAWKASIDQYLEDGGVFLLQHDTDQPIGATLTARVVKDELRTTGYLFPDQMPENQRKAYERKQLNGVSTGHITHEVEWENTATGDVLSNDEAMEEIGAWDLFFSDTWKMAVTVLEWVEQSLVTIQSNRRSKIIKNSLTGLDLTPEQNAKLNFFKNNLGINIDTIQEKLMKNATIAPGNNGPELTVGVDEVPDNQGDKEETTATEETDAPETNDDTTETETPADSTAGNPDETESAENNTSSDTPEVAENATEDATDTPEEAETPAEETPAENAETADENDETSDEEDKIPVTAEQRGHLEKAAQIAQRALERTYVPEDETDETAETTEETTEENSTVVDLDMSAPETLINSLEKAGLGQVAQVITTMRNALVNQQGEVDRLTKIVNTTPRIRSLSVVGQTGVKLDSKNTAKPKTETSKLGKVLDKHKIGV